MAVLVYKCFLAAVAESVRLLKVAVSELYSTATRIDPSLPLLGCRLTLDATG